MDVTALPAATMWSASMVALLGIAIRAAGRRERRRRVRVKVLARALLPTRMLRSRSGRLDIIAFLFGTLIATSALEWALVSADWWMRSTAALIGGPAAVTLLPPWLATALATLVLFVAYEAAYWGNHWLCHRVPWLWAFHKTHHTAESLSLLTNFRVHPVDTILFYNMAAAVTGIAAALLTRSIGPVGEFVVGPANALVFVSTMVLSHLQHSHLWIVLPGRFGRLLLSPAHHQLHHSTDPRHHGRNFGSTLALFDRLAGTLLTPERKRAPLRFGVEGLDYDPHTVGGAICLPFAEAGRALVPAQPEAVTARAA